MNDNELISSAESADEVPKGEICEEVNDSSEEEEYVEESTLFELEAELGALKAEFPTIVAENRNVDAERYKELRAMGLSMKEAYLATSERKRSINTKKHLTDSMPRSAKSPASTMTRREMELARILFDGMSDEQIKKLYNKVK